MAKIGKNIKNKNNKKDNKYNADNEIIIGVTSKPKDKVRVEKNATRANAKPIHKKSVRNTSENRRKDNKHIAKKKTTKEKNIKKKNKKKIALSIIIFLILIICGTIYYLTTPAFNILDIKVFGNEKNQIDTYISLSKIKLGTTNIFAFRDSNIKKNLKENSYVENVIVKRKFPNTVELYVTERKVDYQVEYSNNYIYLSNQGYILEINENNANVPIIKGLTSIKDNIVAGQRINDKDLKVLDIILKITNYCKYNSIENEITSINVADTSNYIISFEKENKKAYLGDASNLSERILWLKTILNKEKNNPGEIFINGDLNKEKVYFREEK